MAVILTGNRKKHPLFLVTGMSRSLWGTPSKDCTLGNEILDIWACSSPPGVTMPREAAESSEMWTKEKDLGVRARERLRREKE